MRATHFRIGATTVTASSPFQGFEEEGGVTRGVLCSRQEAGSNRVTGVTASRSLAPMILLTPRLDSPSRASPVAAYVRPFESRLSDRQGRYLATPADVTILAFGSEGWGFKSLRAQPLGLLAPKLAPPAMHRHKTSWHLSA